MLQIALGLASLAASWFIASLILRYAHRLRLVQTPNGRSSHTAPTPSGAGVGIAIVGTISGLLVAANDDTPYLYWALTCSAIVAVVGLLDDRFELSSRVRLPLHCAVVVILLGTVSTLPPIVTPFGTLWTPVMLAILVLCGVWWINLFNFMDGIDGIASSEAIFVIVASLTVSALGNGLGGTDAITNWSIYIGSATVGFLVLNWPPAKVFMGDAGSNYLAVSILAIVLALIAAGSLSYAAASILCATFVADASVTLLRRMASRQSWRQAHRSHAYQKLSRNWQSHRSVTLSYIVANLIWLFPLALWAQMNQSCAWAITLLAYMPLVAMCIATKAGEPDATL